LDESLIDLLVALLIIGPMVAGLGCFLIRRLPPIGKLVIAVAVVMIAAVLSLSYEVLSDGTIVRPSEDLSSFGVLITILDLALMLGFVYIAWMSKSPLTGVFAVIQIAVMAFIELNGVEEMGNAIYIDQLSVMMTFITSVIGSIICVYAVRYMKHYHGHGRFFAIMLLFLGAMNGAVFSTNLLWMFFFWEVTTLCSFLLIGHTGTERAKRSAITAAEYTLGGGAALILGIALCMQYFDTVFMDQLPIGTGIGGLALLPLALFSVAAFTKSAQIPFQKWLLDAMVAPTPVSALLHSATMVNLGIYLLLRLSPALHGTGTLLSVIGAIGALTFLIAAVLAITQGNAKRVLAYSTISNLGLIVACVGMDSSLALTAAMLLLLFHAISKALLFMSVGVVKEKIDSEDIDAMQGLRDSMPAVSAAMLIGVAMMVLPPFGMFASKWLLSEALTSFPLLALFLVLGFGATLVYYAKWLGLVFTGGTERRRFHDEGTHRIYLVTLMSIAIVGMAATAAIGLLLDELVNPFVSKIFDPALEMNDWVLATSIGIFPMLALIALGIVLVILVLLPRRMPPMMDVYACGERGNIKTGTFYYWSEDRVVKTTEMVNIGMSILLIALMFIPFLMEVTA